MTNHGRSITIWQKRRIDPLTKLANRRAFDLEMTRRFAERDRADNTFSLLLLDIDHFKAFNDEHGHTVGDDVLRHVGEVLTSTMREMDLVARFGGEEFAVVLPMTDLEKAERAAGALAKRSPAARIGSRDANYRSASASARPR